MAASGEVAAHASIKGHGSDCMVDGHARRQAADHRATPTGRTKMCLTVSKNKSYPHAMHIISAGQHSVQSFDDTKLFQHVCCPLNSCRATSAVSRWADGVAIQFVSFTCSHARWRDSSTAVRCVCMATMHEFVLCELAI